MTQPTAAYRVWTPEEEQILVDRRARGEKFAVIARALGRTAKAVELRHYDLRPIAKKKGAEDRIRAASQTLGLAINYEIDRFANDNGIPFIEAVHKLLGGHSAKVAPGTEAIHKTHSIQRHINAVVSQSVAA